jgi:hypothetical protein
MNCDDINLGASCAIRVSTFGLSSAAIAQVATWAGWTVVSAGALTALAFGAGVGVISALANNLLGRIEHKFFKNPWVNLPLSVAVGFGATYGISAAIAALGFTASVITVPTALILTVTGLGVLTLLKVISLLIEKCEKSKHEDTKPRGAGNPKPNHPEGERIPDEALST